MRKDYRLELRVDQETMLKLDQLSEALTLDRSKSVRWLFEHALSSLAQQPDQTVRIEVGNTNPHEMRA